MSLSTFIPSFYAGNLDHNEKLDGGSSLVPKNIAGIKYISNKRLQIAKLINQNSNTSKKITFCLLSVLRKTLICYFRGFQSAIHSGKMRDIRHLFHYYR